jgi:hypothetical protein
MSAIERGDGLARFARSCGVCGCGGEAADPFCGLLPFLSWCVIKTFALVVIG